jgi:hypothetical protein
VELHEQVEAIRTRSDLASFVRALRQDLNHHPEEWENPTLDDYLDALAAWTEDMDGYFKNIHGAPVPEQPSWKIVGYMLIAARIYE